MISQEFYGISGFPGVYGALDCTHTKIQSPGRDIAERFRNRKGYFSLNVQTISDANLKIRDIVASWPGSAHDNTIFDHSHARAVMELNIPNYYHLVADKGYSCRSYVLTPFFEPKSLAERRFNEAHARARNPVERQYGVWKRRFLCLSIGLRTSLKHTMMIIVATAVLHNIAIDSGDTNADFPDSIDIDPDSQQMETSSECSSSGVVKRNSLVKDFFA